jgi:ribosomal protein S18 acetylase RimI-like enzyme
MDLTIRAARARDYDQLCQLIDEVDALHRDNQPHVFRKPSGPVRDKGYILDLIAQEHMRLLVAEVAGQLVGFLHILVTDAPDIPICVPRRYALVDNLVVSASWRRAGIGQALMQEASQWAAAKGAVEIELTVYDFNREAIAFYRSLGYETFSHRMRKSLRNHRDGSPAYPTPNT